MADHEKRIETKEHNSGEAVGSRDFEQDRPAAAREDARAAGGFGHKFRRRGRGGSGEAGDRQEV